MCRRRGARRWLAVGAALPWLHRPFLSPNREHPSGKGIHHKTISRAGVCRWESRRLEVGMFLGVNSPIALEHPTAAITNLFPPCLGGSGSCCGRRVKEAQDEESRRLR